MKRVRRMSYLAVLAEVMNLILGQGCEASVLSGKRSRDSAERWNANQRANESETGGGNNFIFRATASNHFAVIESGTSVNPTNGFETAFLERPFQRHPRASAA